jgi:hypothetical protein
VHGATQIALAPALTDVSLGTAERQRLACITPEGLWLSTEPLPWRSTSPGAAVNMCKCHGHVFTTSFTAVARMATPGVLMLS